MKKTFVQFLLEQTGHGTDTGHSNDSQSNIKADIVDIIRGHVNNANTEILFSSLREGKEKEMFEYYFNKLTQRYGMDAIKDSKLFRNGVTFYFHAPKMKAGYYLKISATFPDEKTAKEVYAETAQKYKKQV